MRPPSRVPAALVVALLAGALVVMPAGAQDPGALRQKADAARAAEQRLSGDVQRLDAAAAKLERQLQVLEKRRAEVQADLERDQAELVRIRADLEAERARLARLRRRLAQARAVLRERLITRYKASDVDVVSVVLNASSFSDLLERADFLKRIQQNDEEIVVTVREARADAVREERTLEKAEARQREIVDALRKRRDALAAMSNAVDARRSALVKIRAARAAALATTRRNRKRLDRKVREAEAAMARAANANDAGMATGGWAIPWQIVQCESGGQNLPPNWAGASGYYQFMPATWRGLGGSTKHAYQASKAEQDRLAARLWAGGAGASNWDCYAIVG